MRTVTYHKQRGVVLVIAMIALLAISLAGVALMRTVDTSNVVSGNIAFNEAASQMADSGAENAYKIIDGMHSVASGGCQTNLASCPVNAAGNAYAYPNVAPIDQNTKLPNPAGGLVWSDPQNINMPGDTAGTPPYVVQYMIERMCGAAITGVAGDDTASFLVTPTFSKCRATPIYDSTGAPTSGQGKLFWRVTVQVNGPRNTHALAQYFYGLQDVVNN